MSNCFSESKESAKNDDSRTEATGLDDTMSLITSTSVEDLACEAFGPESSSPSITDSTFSGSARRARRHGKIFTIPDFFETETNSPSFRISSSESDLRSWRSAEINLDDMNDSRRFPTTKVVSKLTPKQIRLSVSMESMLNVEDSVKLPMNLHEVKQWLRKNSNPGRQAGSVYSASRASQTLRWSGDLQSDDYLPPPPSNGIESLDDDFRLTIVLELPPVRSVEHLGALLDFYEDTKTDVTLGWKQGEILGLDLDSVQEIMEMLQSELDSVEYDSASLYTSYHAQCLRCLRRLTQIYQVLPSSLNLRNIVRDGKNPVGGGGFADIWRGTVQGQPVCLKVLRLIVEQDEEIRAKIRRQFCMEALVWRQLKHPNILPLLGVNSELFSPSFCLVSPWMANKDIITYLRRNPDHDRYTVFTEIAAGLLYLHTRDPPIIHGDIRGANILVTEDGHCCLADFGLSLVATDSRSWRTTTTSAIKGAIRWMAPELITQHGSSAKEFSLHKASRDVYAFGCTAIEIITLQVPYHELKTDAAVLYALLSGERPVRPQSIWCSDAIWDLITRCWAADPSTRPWPGLLLETAQTSIRTIRRKN